MQLGLAVATIAFTFAVRVQAVVVDFTGGTVVLLDTTTATTNNIASYGNVDYYTEGGFKMDFLPNSTTPFATHVGNYYGTPFNDVIHSHWDTGDFGEVLAVEITKIGGGTFDINYFVLTSNTDDGGFLASGNEQAFVEGFVSNVSTGPGLLLPSEDWGFPTTQVFLGPNFDNVDKVVFYVSNKVDCFGMDDFYIDQEFVPEPTSLMMGALLVAVGAAARRRRRESV
jgi:MYXO-CTERM domain-containing protein